MKRILAAAIAVSVGFSVAACGGGGVKNAVLYQEGMPYTESAKREVLPVYSLSYDYLGGKDVMPIGGFYGLYASGGSDEGNAAPNLLSEEYFKIVSEAGINMIVYSVDRWSYGDKANGLTAAFDVIENNVKKYGDEYRMGYFVEAHNVAANLGTHQEHLDVSKVNWDFLPDLVKELNEYDCVLGILAQDEPFGHQLENIQSLREAFYSIDGIEEMDMDVYLNALNYWEGENAHYGVPGDRSHANYVKNLFASNTEGAGLKMLSLTQYPFESANTKESTVTALGYSRLARYRSYAKEYKVPFWRMLQAGGQWNDLAQWIPSVDPYPSEGELLYDVNLALAFGCKSIQYFPLLQPLHFAYEKDENGNLTYDFENRSGLIGADGNLTRWYYFAKRANEQVKAVDHVLMNAENEKIIVHGKTAQKYMIDESDCTEGLQKDGGYYELKKVSGDECVAGCFNYGGKTALYVVNYDRVNKGDVVLDFDGNYKYTVIQRATEKQCVGERLQLRLDFGEGALIVLD